MSLAQILADFKGNVAQCDRLTINAHQATAGGLPLLPEIDRHQITVAAFLNLFIAWESFLESSLAELMVGSSTINGNLPARYVSPQSLEAANRFVIGIARYFDYANHENVRKMVNIYFDRGYPFEPHLSAIISQLADLKTIRNACAHITSTTQTALESLALRISGQPQAGITVYRLLTMTDPKSPTGATVLETYRTVLIVTAELIANG